MKALYFLSVLFIFANPVFAEDKEKQWQPTTLSDETITKIQQSKYKYMECVTAEMQKKTYIKMDTRAATDKILLHCEPSLSHVREVFTAEKVPTSISDRYLKKTRTQTARKVLEQLMFADAARKIGH